MTQKEQIKAEIEQELVEGRLVPIRVDDWMNDFEKEEATMWLEWCENVDYLAYCSIARHFAEWQKEQDMEEWLKDRDGCFWDGVNEGKKAMEEQMLKDAVEGEVVQDLQGRLHVKTNAVSDILYQFGDKVKVIILPKK
jgi:hypothetical protein